MASDALRVLLVSQEMPPETGWGGVGTYVGTLAPALAAAGAHVEVLSVVPEQRRSLTRKDGVVVHRAPLVRPPGLGRLTRLPQTWGRLSLAANVALQRRHLPPFDVIECPDWMAEGLLLTGRRTPVVVRLHSSLADLDARWFPNSSSLDMRWAVRLEAAEVRRADVVTGTAAAVRAHADALDGADVQSHIIPCPVAPATVTPVPVDPPRICFVGRFERRKGPETLVRALPRVREAVPAARLALVGRDLPDPEGRSTLDGLRRLAVTLGVDDALEVTQTWQTPEGVRRHLASATVCAVPSLWESFGYTAAEASAVGRPVLASALPPLRDIVDDGTTGLLLPPEDPTAWGRALAEVLTHPETAQAMGSAGAARVRALFAPPAVAAATLEAYRAAVDRRRPGSASR